MPNHHHHHNNNNNTGTAKKLVKNSKKMNGKCFRSEMKNLFSRLGTRVKASAILPYIQHTFIQNILHVATDDSKDLLNAAYDDTVDSVSVAEDEMINLGSDIVEDSSDALSELPSRAVELANSVEMDDILDAAANSGAMEHVVENSDVIREDMVSGFQSGVIEGVLEGDSLSESLGNGVAGSVRGVFEREAREFQ